MPVTTIRLSEQDLDELNELCIRLYNLCRRNGYADDLCGVIDHAQTVLAGITTSDEPADGAR
jgi:hypothetical protein